MLERFLLFWLVLSSWIAYAWPVGWSDPFVDTKAYLPWLIVVTMFSIGLMLPTDEVRNVLRRWPVVLGGTVIQYTAMPLLAYCVATALGITGDLFIGVILVGCVPGAMASNVLTINARGNASYSVSLTTSATLLSPLAVPLTLGFTLGAWDEKQIDILGKSALMLLWTVVLPVVAGHVIGRQYSNWEATFRRMAPKVANLAILWIIAVVVALNRQHLGDASRILVGALVLINVGGYAAGLLGSRLLKLSAPMCRALTVEVGMQNAGLGATLATHLFADKTQTAIAPAIYTFECMLTGTLLAWMWSMGKGDRSTDSESP